MTPVMGASHPVRELPSQGVPQLPVQLAEQSCCGFLVFYCFEAASASLGYRCCGVGMAFPVLYLIWDDRSTLALQHLPKHGTELEWLLWKSLSRSREAVLSSLLGRAPLPQIPRFSEGAGCVGSYPLSFPA